MGLRPARIRPDRALHHRAVLLRLRAFADQPAADLAQPDRVCRPGELPRAARLRRHHARAAARTRAANCSATRTGNLEYPRVRDITRSDDYPAICGDAGVVPLAVGRQRQGGCRQRRRLHEGAGQHADLRRRGGAGPGRARAAARPADQPAAARHQRLPHDLLHAGRGLDRRRFAALAVHLCRQ